MPIRLPLLVKQQADDKATRAIPFVSTPFSFDLMLFLGLWPLWWILGVEQILPPFFIAWETVRYLWQARGRFTVTAPVVWAMLLAIWWLVPAAWVDREFADIFLKETASAWSQVMILFLFWNAVRTASEWRQAARGLKWLAAFIALGGVIFAIGLWRGSLVSVVGWFLPDRLVGSSTFFRSIAIRQLGVLMTEVGALFPARVSSLTLTPSSVSIVSLLLIPLIVWQIREAAGKSRILLGLVLAGLLVCLVGSESRIAYGAFLVGCGVFVLYRLGLFRQPKRLLLALLAIIGVGAVVFVAVVGVHRIVESIREFFLSWRPGSWWVRLRIYEATLDMLPEHPIAGWGVQQRLPGTRTSFSAGSHSSVLGMLFQHGIVGLFLYIGLWVSIWRQVFRGLKMHPITHEVRGFLVAAAIALLCFNIRELADTWWWDQTVTMALWTLWGLVLAAPASLAVGGSESPLAAEQEQRT
ncbi:MAG: O-antigen ligase family protein [Anaerolineae bacterium]|nr:O-antigen ligase family protein [Anaerolineae bacterium]